MTMEARTSPTFVRVSYARPALAVPAGPPPLPHPSTHVEKRTGMSTTHTERARGALIEAADIERDFGGWLAQVLASVASAKGSSYALVSGRPGSWEADLVLRLVRGTAGWNDEFLAGFQRRT